jgi:choline transport protein
VYWSVLGVVVISITLLATSQKSSPKFVFTEFNNETGWTPGVAWMLGLLQSALSLIGFDASTHMAEEMPNPARDTPLAMVYTIMVGGVT